MKKLSGFWDELPYLCKWGAVVVLFLCALWFTETAFPQFYFCQVNKFV